MVVSGESSRTIPPFGKNATMRLAQLYASIGELDVGKVVEAVACLVEIYHLFGMKRLKGLDSIVDKTRYRVIVMTAAIRCLDYMESINDSKSWIPYFKYKTCAFYAAHEGQDIPAVPVGLVGDYPRVIFGGYFHEFIKMLKVKSPAIYESFAVTILQSKMGMPRADDSMIKAAEEKCARHLTTAPVVVQDHFCDECGMSGLSPYHLANCRGVENQMFWGNGEIIDKQSMIRECRRTVQELFMGKQYTEKLHYEPFFPSTSANYIRSRNASGAVGIVSEIIQGLGLFNPSSSLVDTKIVDGKARSEIAKGYGDDGVAEQARLDLERDVGKLHVGKVIEYDDNLLRAQWLMVMDRIKSMAIDEDPSVEAVGLAEALKIRVISKGPPLLYTFLSPLQKFMWSTLKDNKVFKLISEPITARHVQERIGVPRDDQVIINGDYKASTDNLHSWVSECIGREIVSCIRAAHVPGEGYEFDADHEEMFIRSLIHHQYCVDGVWMPQLEGQLMGSVTSFPVLCLANAAMCRWALEVADNKKYRLSDRPFYKSGVIAPLLINGDDCSLIGSRASLRQVWERITSFGGLSTSIGKTLYSRVEKPVCVLNSTTYHLIEGVWTHVKFVNMGIMFGKTRSGTGESAVRTYSQMGELHKQLEESCPSEVWSEVSKRFIYYNRKALTPTVIGKDGREQRWCIPWSMPEYLGGAGLRKKEDYSELDKWCATMLIAYKDSDKRFRILKEKKDPLWIVHDKVDSRLKTYDVLEGFREVRAIHMVNLSKEFKEPSFSDCEDGYSQFYKYLTVETLFRYELKDLFRLVERTKLGRQKEKVRANDLERHNSYVRRRNNMSWQNAANEFRDHNLRQRQDHEICYEKRDYFKACVAVPPYGE